MSLAPGDGSGLALLGATRSFDGRSFLRAARVHGGIQRYVTRLIERGERVSFRGPKRPAGVQDYLKLLTTAKDAIGSVFSIGKTAYDIFKWAQGPEPTTTDIYKAVLEMKTQLNAIQTSLTELKQKIDDGFRAILDEIKAEEFDRSVKPLEDIASTVYTTQLDFKVLIDNATAPSFNARVAEEKKGAIDRNMNEIEKALNQERDLFRNGILKKRTVPAYYHYGQTLLAGSAHFMTTADSASLQDLAGWVLQYQALAFNLIVRYENHEGQQSPNAILSDAIKTYLGFDASQAKRWVDGESPDVPTSGDLHEELAYLDTIRPVPAHTIVQAMGLDDAPGPMWQASEAAPFHVGSFVGNGRPCADVNWRFSAYGRLWCQFMWDGFNTAIDAVHHALELPGASFANWEPANADQAQALLRTRDVAKVMQIQPDYWIPLNLTPDARVDILGAWRNTEGYRTNSAGGYDEGGSYISDLIDRINLTTVKGPSGDASSCFIGVGYARKASKTGTDCPVLHLLLRRTPADDEHYWPYQR